MSNSWPGGPVLSKAAVCENYAAVTAVRASDPGAVARAWQERTTRPTVRGDGRLMISGGNGSVTTTLYTPATDSVTTGNANLADERWYATMLNLPDGRPVMLGGMVPYVEGMQDNPNQAVAQGLASMTPEVFENGAWRSLFGAYSRDAFGPD